MYGAYLELSRAPRMTRTGLPVFADICRFAISNKTCGSSGIVDITLSA